MLAGVAAAAKLSALPARRRVCHHPPAPENPPPVTKEDSDMLEKLQCQDFSSRIGDTFRLALDGGETLELELIEAAEVGGTAKDRTPFSVVFRGPAEPVLAQQICHLEHRELGSLDLFLVPLSQAEDGADYEAVFT